MGNSINTSSLPHFRLLKIEHPLLSQHSVPGKTKADLVRDHLSKNHQYLPNFSSTSSEENRKPLIKALGEHRILLQCIDCEDQEIIFSHDLLREHQN